MERLRRRDILEAMKIRDLHEVEERIPGWYSINGRDYVISIRKKNHGPKGKSRFGHRIIVQCPVCAKNIPAGKLHQHVGTATCRKHRDKRLIED